MVKRPDPRLALRDNVLALQQHHYGRENLSRLARDAGIGPGSATRIKVAETSVGLEVIDKIAAAFNLDPWQLLVPGFNPRNPPVLKPVSPEEQKLYDRLLRTAEELSRYRREDC
jgi:hypothetical protein